MGIDSDNDLLMPEDVLLVEHGNIYSEEGYREKYFAEIKRASNNEDLDPHMFYVESGMDVNESGLPKRPVTLFGFTSPPLLEWLVRNSDDANKLIKAACTYGYLGNARSTGGLNGIFRLNHSTDPALMRDYQQATRRVAFVELIATYGLRLRDHDVFPAKIVAHVPSGHRILGAIQRELEGSKYDLRAVFFAVGNCRG